MVTRAVALFCIVTGLGFAQVKEFVSENMPTPSCHASTIVELSNGDLLGAWFGGTREGAPDVAIWMARRTQTGWSRPARGSAGTRVGDVQSCPVSFCRRPTVAVLQVRTLARARGRQRGNIAAMRALRWSITEHLPAGLYGPIRAKPLLLSDGTILSGTSVESYGSWACWVERSTDNGQSWTRIGPIAAPLTLAIQPAARGKPHGIIQPSLIDLGNRHIRLYARSTNNIARICQADSLDGGLTWSAVKATELPNPNSGIDVIRLRDGRLVLIYNNTTSGRTPLNLAVSNNGDQWRNFYTLENAAGEYSYPALIQARNGDLLISYTWNRVKIRFVRFPLAQVP